MMLDAGVKPEVQEELPFPYNKRAFCRYEPIEKRIDHARVLIVNTLLRYESDMSDLARSDWNGSTESRLRFENKVSGMACNKMAQNVNRLVRHPKSLTVQLSELTEATHAFRPVAIVMSGTYSDFDYYNPVHLARFAQFIKAAQVPVLAICGSHQRVAQSFGSRLMTLDDKTLSEKRADRVVEYQYKLVKITDTSDPIFEGIQDQSSGIWQDYSKEDDILRVWQNHGVQVEGVPE